MDSKLVKDFAPGMTGYLPCGCELRAMGYDSVYKAWQFRVMTYCGKDICSRRVLNSMSNMGSVGDSLFVSHNILLTYDPILDVLRH